MKRLLHIFLSVATLGVVSCFMTEAKDSTDRSSYVHRLITDIRPVWNMPSNDYYWGYNDSDKTISAGLSAHLRYAFSFPASSTLGKLYPTVYQGIGLMTQTLFSHEITGTPSSIYIFQGGKIADLTASLSIGYDWHAGLSFGWKRHRALATSENIYISVSIPLIWRFHPKWEVSAGPSYSHFSNGDTMFPNGGTNTLGLSVGMTRLFNEETEKAPGIKMLMGEDELKEKNFGERISYDILLYGAWRGTRYRIDHRTYMLNDRFPVAGVCINPLYKLNRYFLTGLSIDILSDRSANLYDIVTDEDNHVIISYKKPGLRRQTAAGISLRGELSMPIFSINIGIGYNIYRPGEIKGLYSLYNLKAHLSEYVYLNFGYRLNSVKHRHNLMLGIGISL